MICVRTDPPRNLRQQRLKPVAIAVLAALLASMPAIGAERPARSSYDNGDKRYPPVEGAENAFDVVYTPKDRCRTVGMIEDKFVKLNVHWPRKEGRYPCVILLHGGGSGGGKDIPAKAWKAFAAEKTYDKYLNGIGPCRREDFAYFVRRGYVIAVVNFANLHRGATGANEVRRIREWDVRTAVRFLRAHAERYRIDPDRFFVYGSSSGTALAKQLLRQPESKLRRASRTSRLLVPLDDPDPAWGDYSATVQGMYNDIGTRPGDVDFTGAPDVLAIHGQGAKLTELAAECAKQGIAFQSVEVMAFKGRPDMHLMNFKTPSITPTDGERKPVRERWVDFMDEIFRRNPRTPQAEFRPNLRIFADPIEMRIITTSDDIAVHYTLDGTQPTTDSPKFAEPIRVERTTTVKALCVRKGERPSGVVTTRFTKVDRLPPRITTKPCDLQAAIVGQAYRVHFKADTDRPFVWAFSGQMDVTIGGGEPNERMKRYHGLDFDPETGVLSGTPNRSGAFHFQVYAGWGDGRQAEARTYVLRVNRVGAARTDAVPAPQGPLNRRSRDATTEKGGPP